jgi:hypothetical protein
LLKKENGYSLGLIYFEAITPHNARTLRLWRERFFGNLDKVGALGYPECFIRLWDFYLYYCEGGFEERFIGEAQLVLANPGYREPHWPSTRLSRRRLRYGGKTRILWVLILKTALPQEHHCGYSLRRRTYPEEKEKLEGLRSLVFFRVDQVLPLVGPGTKGV